MMTTLQRVSAVLAVWLQFRSSAMMATLQPLPAKDSAVNPAQCLVAAIVKLFSIKLLAIKEFNMLKYAL